MTVGPLVDADRLRRLMDESEVVVIDCRWRLGEPGAGETEYLARHIAGAAFLDVDRDLSAAPGPRGRHPLPAPEQFQAAARRAGVRQESTVVAYDRAGEGGAARLWWLLRHFGHARGAVLDGGLGAWDEARGPVRQGPEVIEKGDFEARPREDDTVEAEELVERLSRGAGSEAARDRAEGPARATGGAGPSLLDARAPERYRGEVEPLDPVAGHIPGAVNVPFTELAPGGRFLAPAELRARLTGAGAGEEPVVYCGSGVTACVVALATEVAGLPPARLYPGSWSEWSRRGLPARRGPEP